MGRKDRETREIKETVLEGKYILNELGEVYHKQTGNKLNLWMNQNRLVFNMRTKGRLVRYFVHIEVAKHFLPGYVKGKPIHFRDDNPENVDVRNLYQ